MNGEQFVCCGLRYSNTTISSNASFVAESANVTKSLSHNNRQVEKQIKTDKKPLES